MEQDAFYQVGEFDRSKVDLDKPAMTVDEYMQQVWGWGRLNKKPGFSRSDWKLVLSFRIRL